MSWKSRKQRVVLRSITNAEFRALAFTIIEVTWIQKLLHGIEIKLKFQVSQLYSMII